MDDHDDSFRVWFEDEQAARTRLFASVRDAQNWAAANRPHKPYKLVRKPRSLLRRIRAKFGLLHTEVRIEHEVGVRSEIENQRLLDLRNRERDHQAQPSGDRGGARGTPSQLASRSRSSSA